MAMRTFLGALLALVLTSCTQEAPTEQPQPRQRTQAEPLPAAPAPAAPRAVPLTANGWGSLRIGMTLGELTSQFGTDASPEALGGPDPESCDQFRPKRLPQGFLVMVEDGILTRISLINEAAEKTDRGIGLGATASTVKATYTTAALVTPHKYADAPSEYITVWASGNDGKDYVDNAAARGIRYEVDGSAKVNMIHAGGPSIQLVEGCA